MNERQPVVAKGGGTSNKDAQSVQQLMHVTEEVGADILVVSAPGQLAGDSPTSNKVTRQLIATHGEYALTGEVPDNLTEAVQERFFCIAQGLGGYSLSQGVWTNRWVNNIPARIEQAVKLGEDSASMLGERLQAELVAKFFGFTLLDPGLGPRDLGRNRHAWRDWMDRDYKKGTKYVIPGNTTRVEGQQVTFSTGGSDTTSGYASFGVRAGINYNFTDDSALSADPRIITDRKRLTRIGHLLLPEGRELGRNGTGLVHHEAMTPLMYGKIPTIIRSTFDSKASPTTLDEDYGRAEARLGKVVALSLLENVTLLQVHEPGMAEERGRLAAFDAMLASKDISLIDSRGYGVDAQMYIVETEAAQEAYEGLAAVTEGTVTPSDNLSLVTLVGYRLGKQPIDRLYGDIAKSSGLKSEEWQSEGEGEHSLRIAVKPEQAHLALSNLHRHFVEKV